MLIPARDPPFPSAKPIRHMEYHRLMDQDKVRNTIDGWCFGIMLFGGMGLAFTVLIAGMFR